MVVLHPPTLNEGRERALLMCTAGGGGPIRLFSRERSPAGCEVAEAPKRILGLPKNTISFLIPQNTAQGGWFLCPKHVGQLP